MDKHYIVYIKSTCPYCVQARDELFRQLVNHTVHIMDDEPEGLQKMKDSFNHHTVPMVFIQEGDEETFLGGYTELKNHFDAAAR